MSKPVKSHSPLTEVEIGAIDLFFEDLKNDKELNLQVPFILIHDNHEFPIALPENHKGITRDQKFKLMKYLSQILGENIEMIHLKEIQSKEGFVRVALNRELVNKIISIYQDLSMLHKDTYKEPFHQGFHAEFKSKNEKGGKELKGKEGTLGTLGMQWPGEISQGKGNREQSLEKEKKKKGKPKK